MIDASPSSSSSKPLSTKQATSKLKRKAQTEKVKQTAKKAHTIRSNIQDPNSCRMVYILISSRPINEIKMATIPDCYKWVHVIAREGLRDILGDNNFNMLLNSSLMK